MSTAVAPVEAPAAADPRLAAFLAPDCPEVFHSVATPTAIWKADPYDVETIHAEARDGVRARPEPRRPHAAAAVRGGPGVARRGGQRQDAPDAGVSDARHGRGWATVVTSR